LKDAQLQRKKTQEIEEKLVQKSRILQQVQVKISIIINIIIIYIIPSYLITISDFFM